jgi:PAS domain S-box-containing protein
MYQTSIKQINENNHPVPLFCWDIYSEYLQKLFNHLEDKSFLEGFLKKKTYSKKEDLLNSLKKYDAIILTDVDRRIKWASHGFVTMTGYSISEVIDKKPTLLQGKKTDPKTLEFIRQKVKRYESVKASLINYKKTGVEYTCEIYIEPVFDKKNHHKGFIAFEKEVI